jgi:hypothetical protein
VCVVVAAAAGGAEAVDHCRLGRVAAVDPGTGVDGGADLHIGHHVDAALDIGGDLHGDAGSDVGGDIRTNDDGAA